MRSGKWILFILAGGVFRAVTMGQVGGDKPQFEVASIKLADSSADRVSLMIGPDSIRGLNVTVQGYLAKAYGLLHYQVIGPGWIEQERYTILAKAGRAVPEQEILLMLQELLADRFKVTVHRDEKVLPAYILDVGSKGPKMQFPSGDEGRKWVMDTSALHAHDVSMQGFARYLTTLGRFVGLDVPVVDQTNLSGTFDFDVPCGRDVSVLVEGVKQMGLKMTMRKTPIEVVVVDHVERPSEN